MGTEKEREAAEIPLTVDTEDTKRSARSISSNEKCFRLLDYRLPDILDDEETTSRTRHSANRSPQSLMRKRRVADGGNSTLHEREYILDSITLIYKHTANNLFTKERLEYIKEFETKLSENSEYKNHHCRLQMLLGTWQCIPILSILRFFDGTLMSIDSIFYDPNFSNIQQVLSFASTHPSTKSILPFFLGKNKNIDVGANVSSDITRSVMYFGWPLAGFAGTKSYQKQFQQHRQWAYAALVPILREANERGVGPMAFYFRSQTLLAYEASLQVFQDWYFIIGSFLFIFLFTWFQTGSLWITFFGIFSVISSFIGANLIYTFVYGFKFFGMFNVMSLFVILGIGADDIFIFCDTWKSDDYQELPTVAHRLSKAYKRSSITMLVTSLTTMAAFFSSAFSPILPVAAFGAFAGTAVLVDYLSVITFLPPVVIIHHKYFDNKQCLCCCSKKPRENARNSNFSNGVSNQPPCHDRSRDIEKPRENARNSEMYDGISNQPPCHACSCDIEKTRENGRKSEISNTVSNQLPCHACSCDIEKTRENTRNSEMYDGISNQPLCHACSCDIEKPRENARKSEISNTVSNQPPCHDRSGDIEKPRENTRKSEISNTVSNQPPCHACSCNIEKPRENTRKSEISDGVSNQPPYRSGDIEKPRESAKNCKICNGVSDHPPWQACSREIECNEHFDLATIDDHTSNGNKCYRVKFRQRICIFFGCTFFTFVSSGARWVILLLFVAVVSLSCWQVSQIQLEEKMVRM